MQTNSEISSPVNPDQLNGRRPIKGRGVKRRKLGVHQRAELAIDTILGMRMFVPSCAQAARDFNVPVAILREHLKRRKPDNGNGRGNGNGGNRRSELATPVAPAAPDPNRFVKDHQLADLITALDATIELLRDLREGQS